MYAWSTGSFDNEHADDWVKDLLESEDLECVLQALEAALLHAGTEDLDAADCACAVAAAEIVAAVGGRPAANLSKPLRKYTDSLGVGVAPSVRKLAQDAMAAVKLRSALRTHWKSAGLLTQWLDDLEDLEARLAEKKGRG